jgi:energy-coupling factor transporter ATP-binding protein EcfA2
MKILSIRLHPFGGTSDRTCSLQAGINVLDGPNEFGKSTLFSALGHVLFTKTNLTPAALRDTMGRWYPKPSGDHVKVSLSFEADGRRWDLEKTWGAGATARLSEHGAAPIADPSGVQSRLDQLLCRNEATWRNVLFTGQAQLARTVEELQKNAAKLDDVESLLAGAAAIPGDIPVERMLDLLSGRIKTHFSHWDRNAHTPERGRGINNPWAKEVGPVLAAYYKLETFRRDLIAVRQHEDEVDRINTGITRLTREMDSDRPFVAAGKLLRDGLNQRHGLEEQDRRLSKELQELKQVMIAWPGADKLVEGKNLELKQVQTDMAALVEELTIAKKRAGADQLRKNHQQLNDARSAWKLAADQLSRSPHMEASLLTELKGIEPEIVAVRVQIAAQRLTARLLSKGTLTIGIQRGAEAPETLSLQADEPWEGEAAGKFTLEMDGLSLSVESGTADVNALFAKLETAQQRRDDLLKTLMVESLAHAEQADRDRQKIVAEERLKKELYQRALQSRTEEEWEASMADLAALPDTRSVEALEAARGPLQKREIELDQQIRIEQERSAKWVVEHVSPDALTDKMIAKTSELQVAQGQLAGLPALPEGFDSVTSYLQELSTKEAIVDRRHAELSELKLKQAQLAVAQQKQTAEELQAEFEIQEREFKRQKLVGEALLRIESKLQEIAKNEATASPMARLSEMVSRHFETLTCGRYQSVGMEGTAPVSIRGSVTLPPSLLSQGTLGSLALATRLALSELYLDSMEGFLVLDDPFTDMDDARRLAAGQAIGAFAKDRQVILFTCHPTHARDLQEQAGASPIKVSV